MKYYICYFSCYILCSKYDGIIWNYMFIEFLEIFHFILCYAFLVISDHDTKRNNSANVVSIYLFSYHDTVYHTSTNITMFIQWRQNLKIRNILQIFLVIIILYIYSIIRFILLYNLLLIIQIIIKRVLSC